MTNANRVRWEFLFYVAGRTPRSEQAMANLKNLCERRLHGKYRVTTIDIAEQPELARADSVIAIPTLVRILPKPRKTVIGSMSDTARVVKALELPQEMPDLPGNAMSA